jgi:hypothetical protein
VQSRVIALVEVYSSPGRTIPVHSTVWKSLLDAESEKRSECSMAQNGAAASKVRS